ncbi:MAG: glycosyltransferase [Pseudomonadota bacterium]|nr:glycosyltransferase [Pseudomonadota bacterium]
MKVVYFTHSLESCWNHGNAHFLRGVLRDLIARGHEVAVHEPREAWSRANLIADHGEAGLAPYRRAYPDLSSHRFDEPRLDQALDGADLVIVHEWNQPALVAAVGRARKGGGRFTLLFHDTHHRAVSEPDGIRAFDLTGYDGVLAFGETLAEVYRRWGWGDRVFVWHEAADVRLFRPPAVEQPRDGLIWIGNWGDGERTKELESFLFAPARAAGLSLDIHGVRYPPEALATLKTYGVRYHGWLANAAAPDAFARHMATVHVPRRFYVRQLPGIPTIRVFEALACGIPLVSAPWEDSEGLFTVGEDFLMVRSGDAMRAALRSLKADPDLREALAARGLAAIRARHTCTHRVDELLAIAARLEAAPAAQQMETA